MDDTVRTRRLENFELEEDLEFRLHEFTGFSSFSPHECFHYSCKYLFKDIYNTCS
jgi:hypothetical protein